jgi:hypothetical protein
LRYDPTLELTRDEDTPQLRALFKKLRPAAQALDAITVADLGRACEEVADVLLVVRPLGPGRIQINRFDGCTPAGKVVLAEDESAALAVLSVGTPPLNPRLPQKAAPKIDPRTLAMRAGGLSILAVGAALAVTGIYFGADAASRRSDFNKGCAAEPCSNDELARRTSNLSRAETIAAVTASLGAVALATGAALTWYGFRSRHEHARLSFGPLTASVACDF